jgi:two-component system, NtrC family, nitrogen regulation sensor histidine kinase NtrY
VIFRRKLLLLFALTVFFSVASVAWMVSVVTRRAFERASEAQTAALVAQFQRQFDRYAADVVLRVQTVAASDTATRIAMSLARGAETSGYLNDAAHLAEAQQLDFLEFVDSRGGIVSSAQAPARFGYPENTLTNLPQLERKSAFLKEETDESGQTSLGLFAVRTASAGNQPLYVIGGRRIDNGFMASLDLPAGMRAMLFKAAGPVSPPKLLTSSGGDNLVVEKLAPLLQQTVTASREQIQLLHLSDNPKDDEAAHAIPLAGPDDKTLGILVIASSRKPYVELKQHIQSAALIVGGLGILVALLLSSWIAARITRPVEELAVAARQVADGNLRAHVDVESADELGDLAEAFNQMTRDLVEQKDRLVQSERVAAWRELARRLAHELKNPLFPLQLTVENLVRARDQSPAMFDEIFRESAATLLAEINNLKQIISRFSEFSKMPQPHLQPVIINELMQGVRRLFQPQFEESAIAFQLELNASNEPIAADPELLHRALSNLVLNAMDAIAKGGTLTLRTWDGNDRVHVEIADTGAGLTKEECERLFTPYYTSKQHGTGLGLAIVQSVISDHGGSISVHSQPGTGTRFLVELPRNLDKLQAPMLDGTATVSGGR